MSNSQSPASRFMGCLLGGAVGDALGAPAESTTSLEGVLKKFGPAGMNKLYPYKGYADEEVAYEGIGAITDDTAMHAATLGAMVMAQRHPDKLHVYAWQGYLRWAVQQTDGLQVLPHLSLAVDWPKQMQPFWFASGAGRGTMAALSTGRMGTLDNPLTDYEATIRGQHMHGPNDGCGGMMRVAGLAFWPAQDDKFRLGMENAAITHGGRNACLASGCISELTSAVADGLSLRDAFGRMSMRLRAEPDNDAVLAATEYGWDEGRLTASFKAIDSLPRQLGHKNAFLAAPVLAQSVYALSAYFHQGLGFKETLTLAATHGGDTDSVAAIVGNVLGAHEGVQAVPQDWLAQLPKRSALEELGRLAVNRLSLSA